LSQERHLLLFSSVSQPVKMAHGLFLGNWMIPDSLSLSFGQQKVTLTSLNSMRTAPGGSEECAGDYVKQGLGLSPTRQPHGFGFSTVESISPPRAVVDYYSALDQFSYSFAGQRPKLTATSVIASHLPSALTVGRAYPRTQRRRVRHASFEPQSGFARGQCCMFLMNQDTSGDPQPVVRSNPGVAKNPSSPNAPSAKRLSPTVMSWNVCLRRP